MTKKLAKQPVKPTKSTPIKKASNSERALDVSWHKRFLEILGGTCNVTLSAKGAGIDKVTAYKHRDKLPEFAAQWAEAKESAIEILEAEAWQRARKKSDLLMIFLLKAHKPEMYREKVDLNHGGAIQHSVVRVPAKATSKEEWEQQQKEQGE